MGVGIGKWDLTFPQDLLPMLDMHKIHSHSLINSQNNLVPIPIKQKILVEKKSGRKEKRKILSPFSHATSTLFINITHHWPTPIVEPITALIVRAKISLLPSPIIFMGQGGLEWNCHPYFHKLSHIITAMTQQKPTRNSKDTTLPQVPPLGHQSLQPVNFRSTCVTIFIFFQIRRRIDFAELQTCFLGFSGILNHTFQELLKKLQIESNPPATSLKAIWQRNNGKNAAW